MAKNAFVLFGRQQCHGAIKKGVLFGFCQGPKLADTSGYLTYGTNKQVFYKIFISVHDIDFEKLTGLLQEAVAIDGIQ